MIFCSMRAQMLIKFCVYW